MFGGEVNERRTGEGKKLATAPSEQEHIDACKQYLGVNFSGSEQGVIQRMISMIVR